MRVKIALAGNPNSGKTTLFNALTTGLELLLRKKKENGRKIKKL